MVVERGFGCFIVSHSNLIRNRAITSTLVSYAGDICLFLFRALEDGFHDIKKAACACICMLSAKAPASVLEPHAEKLLQVDC